MNKRIRKCRLANAEYRNVDLLKHKKDIQYYLLDIQYYFISQAVAPPRSAAGPAIAFKKPMAY